MKKCIFIFSILMGLSLFCSHSIEICNAAELNCNQLTSLRLPDAIILSSKEIPAAGTTPAYCLVEGVIDSEIKIQVRLPDKSAWNEKFFQIGNGGFAGAYAYDRVSGLLIKGPSPLQRGYAIADTDTGHVGAGTSASWALNDRKAQINFGFQAVHRTAVIAKRVIEAYYARAPLYSYHVGCSRGGGQGLIEAERYPGDFDGIVAGAPAWNWTGFPMGFVWNQQFMWPNWPSNTTPTLPNSKLGMLSSTILAKCDTLDGLVDGLINDPRNCDFDPYRDLPICSTGDGPTCFTSAQLAAIERVYSGPSNSKGQIFFGFSATGVESFLPAWPTWVTDGRALWAGNDFPNAEYAFGRELMRYFVYSDPAYQIDNFNFETDVKDTAKVGAILNGDPNLASFKVHGGKMIMFNGWADYAITPLGTIYYYEEVARRMGNRGNVNDFFRLFLAPGMCHCYGGLGPNYADWLTAIEQWVENGIAPDYIIAEGLNLQNGNMRTRPLCAYPKVDRYIGSGSPDDAANFVCVEP